MCNFAMDGKGEGEGEKGKGKEREEKGERGGKGGLSVRVVGLVTYLHELWRCENDEGRGQVRRGGWLGGSDRDGEGESGRKTALARDGSVRRSSECLDSLKIGVLGILLCYITIA